jgi:GDPmannose 4,6-dehydratase
MAKKKALITGILGQDGAYLAKLLLERGYAVHGAARPSASWNDWRLRELGIETGVAIEAFDLLDYENIRRLVDRVRPEEVYNLAAQSLVGASFTQPLHTADVDAMGVLRLLEVCRSVDPAIRFYQASSSEMFGGVSPVAFSETASFHPRSPYAVAKVFAHHATVNYREAYGLHASAGILFNHESPLRGRQFVTRKISSTLAGIKAGADATLRLGNLEAKRDWGFAGDFVEAIHLMVCAEHADDYVVATGRTRSVRDFVDAAAAALGFDLDWSGSGLDETARERKSGRLVVEIGAEFFRPVDVDTQLGDAGKARRALHWTPSVDFEALVTMMARADYDRVMSGRPLM